MPQDSYGPVNSYTPGASLSPDLAASYAATNWAARNAPTDRTATGYSAGYQYRPGESQDSYITNNAKKDANSPATAINWMNPVGFGTRAYKGKAAYKRSRAEYEENQRQYQVALQNRDAENYQIAQGYRKSEDDRKRGDNLRDLDAAFASGDRQKTRQNQYDASMGASLATLGKQASDSNRENALALARRGVLGGSEDAEKQAGVGANYQTGVVDATTRAAQHQAALNQADVDQYHALRQSILTGSPEEAAQTVAAAGQLTSQAEQQNQLYDFGAAHNALNAQGANNTSQLIGGIGGAGADAYYNYQGVSPQQYNYNRRTSSQETG